MMISKIRAVAAAVTLVLANGSVASVSMADEPSLVSEGLAFDPIQTEIVRYSDRVDQIFSDGFESGDIAALRRATNRLTAQIDGIISASDDAPACVRQVVSAAYDLDPNQVSFQDRIATEAFLHEVTQLRLLAESCARSG